MWLGKRAIFLVCALLLCGCAANPPMQSSAFPDLRAFELEGKLPEKLKGQVVLVDFWASWCAPCKVSFPAMEDLNKQYAGQGLVIVAVSVDEKQEDMQRFFERMPVSFVTVRDAKQKLVAAVNVQTMPTSFLIGRDGTMRYTHSGFYGDQTVRQYRDEIEQLLKEPILAAGGS
jgi:thiol-disulfide isomerase/thioredoxin